MEENYYDMQGCYIPTPAYICIEPEYYWEKKKTRNCDEYQNVLNNIFREIEREYITTWKINDHFENIVMDVLIKTFPDDDINYTLHDFVHLCLGCQCCIRHGKNIYKVLKNNQDKGYGLESYGCQCPCRSYIRWVNRIYNPINKNKYKYYIKLKKRE